MIISASYKTDIPAFYGRWFLRRLDAGYCGMHNAWNGDVRRVSLARDDVDGFVFWTKNVGPFLPALDLVRGRGFPFIVQYTITGYPRALETSVVVTNRAVGHVHEIANRFSPRAAIWRYDPILLSSLTPPAWHVDNFGHLAAALRGATTEVVISFVQVYAKTRRNLDLAAEHRSFTWHEASINEKRELLATLTHIAATAGLQLTLCAQPDLLIPGTQAARCVDAKRLGDLAGCPLNTDTHGNRPGCLCARAIDIGEYDTCPHGCTYCYAVRNPMTAKLRYQRHDPASPFLFGPDAPLPPTPAESTPITLFPRYSR